MLVMMKKMNKTTASVKQNIVKMKIQKMKNQKMKNQKMKIQKMTKLT